MNNSLILRSITKLWSFCTYNYESSLVKRCYDSVKSYLRRIRKDSLITNFLATENRYIESSILYGIFSKVMDLFSQILKKIHDFMKCFEEGSFIFKTIKNLYRLPKKVDQKNRMGAIWKYSWSVVFIKYFFSLDEAGDRG